jgi:hypothetical protein
MGNCLSCSKLRARRCSTVQATPPLPSCGLSCAECLGRDTKQHGGPPEVELAELPPEELVPIMTPPRPSEEQSWSPLGWSGGKLEEENPHYHEQRLGPYSPGLLEESGLLGWRAPAGLSPRTASPGWLSQRGLSPGGIGSRDSGSLNSKGVVTPEGLSPKMSPCGLSSRVSPCGLSREEVACKCRGPSEAEGGAVGPQASAGGPSETRHRRILETARGPSR